MLDLLNRLALRLPGIRSLVEENAHLQSEVSRLHAQLNSRTKQPAPIASTLWVPPGHFYSPIVDARESSVQRAMDSEANPSVPLSHYGIDEGVMLQWFHLVAEQYSRQPFPEHPGERQRYGYVNPNFPLADALAFLAAMIRFRPKRLIEVGSGYSSCAAIDIVEYHLGYPAELTFIDPNPELAIQLIGPDSLYRDRFLHLKLQDTPISVFCELEQNDMLFIDSSHVAKTGSDVLDYIFRVLPSLNSGVLVHIHDVFYPFEYPRDWIEAQNRSWNEAYLLRAYLHCNSSVRVFYMSDWFYKCRRALVEQYMPLCITHRGGSLWLEIL